MDFTDQMSRPVKAVHQVWKPDGKQRKKSRVEGTFLRSFRLFGFPLFMNALLAWHHMHAACLTAGIDGNLDSNGKSQTKAIRKRYPQL
jgi:hypothetical protein